MMSGNTELLLGEILLALKVGICFSNLSNCVRSAFTIQRVQYKLIHVETGHAPSHEKCQIITIRILIVRFDESRARHVETGRAPSH